MNKCQFFINEGLRSHRMKTNESILGAIEKYKESLLYVPKNGELLYPRTGYSVTGERHIKGEIFKFIAYAYHDLDEISKSQKYYKKAIEYNPNNPDAKNDRTLPYSLRSRYDNEGASGSVAYSGESLCDVIVKEN